ncbi:Leucine Rich Repeat family protein [Trichomonas vaginalis G3]|uniref:Leucine Rich Repeat family protein n=1 Tax=Trichomonas vaginalis (strain ATCC PRA-98 / G3) TaxID=412133 RepID=A2DF96_TRIV3|nr:uncharacterized protein TVAGG3_0565810 [Trichomonas vaginalis G3]EAY20824.1 Leucine Rich Repeat family protein [Trichomonas vaginalis G3]KAI5521568.1 ribonuclease inhibitor domain-containing protein [Trichomonas vaginalis G3]|eukprot:XP_001581810.1 hypothetical protein [Trichomonas vaginalis G3]
MNKTVNVSILMSDGKKHGFTVPFSEILQNFVTLKIGDIRELSICHCSLSPDDVNYLMPLIPPNLQSIRLSNLGLKHNHLKILVKKLMTINLVSIDLSNNPIADESIWILLDLLGKKTSLIDINLSYCNLSGNGMFPLLNGISCQEINSLDLSGNTFGYIGANYLQNYIRNKPKVNYIICTSCELSPSDIDTILQGIPEDNQIHIDLRSNEKILERKLPPNVYANQYHMK